MRNAFSLELPICAHANHILDMFASIPLPPCLQCTMKRKDQIYYAYHKLQMFALQCKNQDYHILDFIGHVLQNWRDVCAYFTLTHAKFWKCCHRLLHIELPCSWHVQNMHYHKEYTNLTLHNKLLTFKVVVMSTKLMPLSFT